MAQTTKPDNETCAGNCAGCPSATGCNDPRNAGAPRDLPPKADISVKHVVLVLSGKGGVGKSTVSANLAFSLANRGYNTGLIDLDIHGPDIPKMLGIESARLQSYDGKIIEPVRVTGNLAVISMAFLLPERNTPVIWRGPMKMTVIRQFLEDVNWGDLDYLIVDLPPGTGDEALTIAQLAPNIAGAVIVTTPQDVAVLDSSKAIEFVRKLDIQVLGVVENMSGFVCPHCKEEIDIFGKGGGEREAKERGVPFLGAIPLDPEMRKAADEGRPFIIRQSKDSPTWKSFDAIMNAMVEQVEG
ncbi:MULTISPECIES: Mrp/NBP35 family ATP-binding protein [unclassified Methanoculleus]|jgi:Mrp family chromosome partitioning ATPase|uniref:Iron-sulfur cluster carrier protein n=1 Tax=Methanoculleus palmolei TaxID=72612 RepID=A0ABD8A615_9EURY|nr:Mrp/NBP35 family ATP-binding protein [Methanoculleus sp. UBA377]WOX54922.1 Mrp/NBP35 family ATP-binding protein [Methanoculleus palmolei]